MEYTYLGRSSAKVSRICLGTMNFGPVIDDAASFALLDSAFESGVNFIDSADVYGSGPFGDYYGQSEEILGKWITGKPRDQLVIATKLHGPMGLGVNDEGFSAIHIRHAVDASLQRLQTDYIDLYQMHHIVPRAPIEEIFEAFAILRQQGKVLYFGSSNFPGWQLARYQDYARELHQFGLVSEQSLYHLAERSIEQEVIPAAEHYGLGILPWSPVGAGLLAGILARTEHNRSQRALDLLTDDRRARVQRYEDFARDTGHAPADLALAWLLHQPAVTAPIVGPRTQAHLDGALKALTIELGEAQLTALDEIWPGRGPAPEAYSW